MHVAFTDDIREFLKGKIRELYEQLNEEEQIGCNRIFPKGIDAIPDKYLQSAIDLFRRTIDNRL
jgi:hypothetical protein